MTPTSSPRPAASLLPGVGAFAACMAALEARPGVVEAMTEAVHGKGAPFLGICVGMQLLASRGLEFGETPGLDWIAGDVRRLDDGGDPAIKIPHMGWNNLTDVADHPLFAGLKNEQTVYFTHSFAFFPKDERDVAAYVEHGGQFPAARRARQCGRRAIPSGEVAGLRPFPSRALPGVATVILYPAIDLKDGQCVRVVHGDLSTATVFNTSPAAQAKAWADGGFHWIHVVDLNGAGSGKAVNQAAVAEILGAVSVPVQLGGGTRTLADIEGWIEAGVSRVILGTVAVREPQIVREAAKAWPEQVAVSVDVRKGKVAVQGWTEDSDLDAITVAKRFEDVGVSALIITDIDRDGTVMGFNVEAFGAIADAVAIPVIAAGGLATVDDIVRLKARPGTAIAGAILGRALYNGAIVPDAALKAAA